MEMVSTQSVKPDTDDGLIFFSESLSSIFDDVPITHGDPEYPFLYDSKYGPLSLRLTTTRSWEEQLKFSHFVWSAELALAKKIETSELDVRGLRVLELGAGAGLCGILSCFAGAADVVLSDYPAESMLTNLRSNVHSLLPSNLQAIATVVGHVWGEDTSTLLEAGHFQGPFDVILLADCLWMPEQHDALCRTLVSTLKKSPSAKICCIAGFHTGRRKLANFFSILDQYSLMTAHGIKEMNHKDVERTWDASRPEEDSVERKRWLVLSDIVWLPNKVDQKG